MRCNTASAISGSRLADLRLAPDHGIELARAGEARQAAGVLIERRRARADLLHHVGNRVGFGHGGCGLFFLRAMGEFLQLVFDLGDGKAGELARGARRQLRQLRLGQQSHQQMSAADLVRQRRTQGSQQPGMFQQGRHMGRKHGRAAAAHLETVDFLAQVGLQRGAADNGY